MVIYTHRHTYSGIVFLDAGVLRIEEAKNGMLK